MKQLGRRISRLLDVLIISVQAVNAQASPQPLLVRNVKLTTPSRGCEHHDTEGTRIHRRIRGHRAHSLMSVRTRIVSVVVRSEDRI